ncbi:MAG: hydantoinase/oxoprolinase family protein [Candidatus Dormibacteria bacterium]
MSATDQASSTSIDETARYYVGVDIGGTFTDVVAADVVTGELKVVKTPSTPPTFIQGILNGVDLLGVPVENIELFIHGSTIATNGIIERKGPLTALVTTAGFRDVLLCARATRPDVYDLRWRPAKPLVLRRNVLEVVERTDFAGRVVTPLDEDAVRRLAVPLRKRGVRSVAICFLNSFMNPDHELAAKRILAAELPDVYISASCEVFPEIREFERTSTVVANAYLAPLVDDYLKQLIESLRARGLSRDLLVVHSGGGVITDSTARRLPARMCNSGPAGGVVGGAYIGLLAGFSHVITMDIGGTSTDVALIRDGRPVIRAGLSIEHNIPVLFPSVDVTTIGAGGGSISWVDRGGILRNGPQSAGANPGPACYGQGGREPTNTDAQLVLGRLSDQGLLGGQLRLDSTLADRAIAVNVASKFGWSLEEAASAMLTVANANIVNAIRLISIQRGHDPRDFALIAFGGGGPMHAVEVARELGIPHVVVPPNPGLASAFGMLHVDVRHDLVRPLFRRQSELSAELLNGILDDLERDAKRLMSEEGIDARETKIERYFDMKYFPQSSYLTLAGAPGRLTDADVKALVDGFNDMHMREFGYSVPSHAAEVEVGHVRLVVTGAIRKPDLAKLDARGSASTSTGDRRVFFKDQGWVPAAVYVRQALGVGAKLRGPAVIDQFDSTTVLPPGSACHVDEYGNLIVTVED